jgi:GNAT superfamily N-acetyltransferase
MTRISGRVSPRPGSSGPAADQRQAVTLPDGTPVLIARLTPDDAPGLADGFARLSTESRRLRFLTSKPRLSEAELRYLTTVDGHDHEALAAIDPETQRGVAVARFVRDRRDQTRAEAAITVSDEWQRRGLGKLLLERLSDRARAEGITHFTALVSTDNRGMQALVKHFGESVRVAQVAGGTFEYEIELGPSGLAAQLEAALRAAATGHLQLPPRLCEVLRTLVPIHLGQRPKG